LAGWLGAWEAGVEAGGGLPRGDGGALPSLPKGSKPPTDEQQRPFPGPEQAPTKVGKDSGCVPDKAMKLPSSTFPYRIAAKPAAKDGIVRPIFVHDQISGGVGALGAEAEGIQVTSRTGQADGFTKRSILIPGRLRPIRRSRQSHDIAIPIVRNKVRACGRARGGVQRHPQQAAHATSTIHRPAQVQKPHT